jgi:threonine dehydrogenase-like Zn-dependent dehydrogenase
MSGFVSQTDSQLMRALLLGNTPRLVDDYPTPEPLPGEALIRVSLASICNTDLELIKGYEPSKQAWQGILGHEFVGVVERAPGIEEWQSKRVVGDINAACATCSTCQEGRPTHCPSRTTLGIANRDGAFAEYLTLPIRNLRSVPDDLPDDVAVFTEPVAAACEILQQVHVRPTDHVAVLGDGKLGLLCSQVLALTGCHLIAVGRHPEKLEILARRAIPTALESELDAEGFDLVVDATGHPDGYAATRRLVRPRGTIVLKSTYHGPLEANLTMAVVDEITLVGSRCGPFEPALRLLQRGLVDTTSLIEARYPLSDPLPALEHAARPGALKILIDTAL